MREGGGIIRNLGAGILVSRIIVVMDSGIDSEMLVAGTRIIGDPYV